MLNFMKARTVNSIIHYSCNSSWILVADTIWFSGFNETRVRVGLLLPQIRKKDNENWSDPILSEDIGLASKGHRYFFSLQMNLFYCCKDKVTLVRSIFPIDIQQGPIFAIEVQFSQRDRFLNKKKKWKKCSDSAYAKVEIWRWIKLYLKGIIWVLPSGVYLFCFEEKEEK